MDRFQLLVLRALAQMLREIIFSQRDREKTEKLIEEIRVEIGEPLEKIKEKKGESHE